MPAGVTHLSVELYGAGGGGTIARCNGGGGGGGGAYTSTILAVQEGQTLIISVGTGGAPGTGLGVVGGTGGDTAVLDANSNTVLVVGHGGGGGLLYPPAGFACGMPAPGALGGAPDPNAMISHSGAATPSFSITNSGGIGYALPSFPFQPNGQFGGGGAGTAAFSVAQPGQGGYALLNW